MGIEDLRILDEKNKHLKHCAVLFYLGTLKGQVTNTEFTELLASVELLVWLQLSDMCNYTMYIQTWFHYINCQNFVPLPN